MQKLFHVLCAASFMLGLGLGIARGDVINGSTTGLASPATTITFGEIPLATNAVVTNQYAGLGVTFSPNVYYNPEGWPPWANNVGNFTFPTEPSYVNPVTLMYSSTQSAAAFQMAADGSPYLFQAFLGGTLVDSFTNPDITGNGSLYYGFSNESFDSLVLTYQGGGGGPYWLMSNLELSNSNVIPEPSSLLLLGTGLAGLAGMLRRKLFH